jgi:hypothetical protein
VYGLWNVWLAASRSMHSFNGSTVKPEQLWFEDNVIRIKQRIKGK